MKKLAVFLVLIGLAVPGNASNLVENPGFESGVTGWENLGGCVISAVSDQTISGNYSGLISSRTSSWNGPRQDLMNRMLEGVPYEISAWVKLDNSSSSDARITIKKVDGAGTTYKTVDSIAASGSQWLQISGSYTLDISGALSSLHFYIEGPDAGINFYVDDVVIGENSAPPQVNIPSGSVDGSNAQQTIEGFGASAAYYQNWLYSHPEKQAIYDAIFGDLGLDILRVRNVYGIEPDFQYATDPLLELTASAESMLGRPLKLMATSWSPPAYLKSNGTTDNGGTLAKDGNGDYKYGDFAAWWHDSIQAYANRGILFDFVSIQNEPDFTATWDSCRLDATESSSTASYAQALDAVSLSLNQLLANPPKLIGPETISLARTEEYIAAIQFPEQLYGSAYHLYADGDFDDPDASIPDLKNFQAIHGERPIFQTEYARLDGGNGFRGALDLARNIHNVIVEGRASAYLHWDLFWGASSDGSEGPALVLIDNPWVTSIPTYEITHKYYAFRQFSKFVESGWTCMDVESLHSQVKLSAFADQEASRMSIVLINEGTQDLNYDLSVSGFTLEDSEIYRTSATEYTDYVGAYTQGSSVFLPAESITTIYLIGANSDTGGNEPEPPVVEDVIAHIDTIDVELSGKGKKKQGSAWVKIVDETGTPLSGVTVTGTFSQPFEMTVSGVTDSYGVSQLVTSRMRVDTTFSFCVDDVVPAIGTYDSTANLETCDTQ